MTRRVRCVSIAMAMVLAGSLVEAARAASATGPPPRRELSRLLDQTVAAGAPGAIALVEGRRDWAGASGVADRRTGRPMHPRDRFRVASLTKPFVATVMLQLVAENRLSLSDTVERWLPGILPYADQITVRQLLNHTSGVPNNTFVPIVEIYNGNRFRSWRPAELVALIAEQPPDFPAGTAWSYSNTGYALVGMIIERVTGRDLGRELERRILRPLHLNHTSFPTDFPFLLGRHARGYSLPLDGELNPLDGPMFDITVYNPSLAWAAGNMVSTADDLARFFDALLSGRLLPPALLSEMKTPVEIFPGIGYGLGLEVSESPCGTLFGHSGGIMGYTNLVLSSEDGEHQFATMFNASAAPPEVFEPFNRVVAQGIREAFAGDPCTASASLENRPAAPLNSEPSPIATWPEATRARR